MVNDVKARLTSRKFWLAIGAFVTFMANGNTVEAMAVILGYLGVEGASDVAQQIKK